MNTMSHHGHHGYPVTQQMRLERRKRAEDAQKEYNDKHPTLQSKLDALPANGANKQRARLQGLIQAAATKAEATKLAAATKVEAKAEKVQNKKGKAQ
jgi:hypothetical protein